MAARQLITLRIPTEQVKRIDRLARETRLSRTEYMTRCALGEAINPHSAEERLDELTERVERLERAELLRT